MKTRPLAAAATVALLTLAAAGPAWAALVYDFNTGTLQGWNNRVWDLSANAGAGGWVDLAPNVTTMPPTINGGVIQPPGAGNGLFVNNANRLYPGGDTDTHMNTLWARSPVFYLDGSGNMTFSFLGGASGGTPPANDSSIPFAATAGLWKGLALRDANTGQYVLTKNNTANGGSAQSFTAAELAPFVGSTPYTLDLLNMSRGG